MSITDQLRSVGMTQTAAQQKAELFSQAAHSLPQHPSVSSFVPGRVEFLGKHTDYAGGRSLLAAIERGICLVALPRSDIMMRVTDARSGEEIAFPLDPSVEPAVGHWSNYPMTVARRVARNFPELSRGADIAFASDLPQAAGMSSSSALMVAIFLALAEVNHIERSPRYRDAIHSHEELAAYLGCVENGQSFGALAGDRGVGTFGGSEDHVAMLCCEPGKLSQYSFCPVRFERSVAFPEDHVLVIAASGVVAEKTGAAREAYNQAAMATQAIVSEWNAATGDQARVLGDLFARGPEMQSQLAKVVSPSLIARLEQLVTESETIIPAAADALARHDLATLGTLVDRSQRNSECLLGNQVPETIHLARSARTLGAAAASAFGAGFGGSVWAMVSAGDAERFAREWREAYVAAFPQHAARAEVFVTRPGPAAMRLE